MNVTQTDGLIRLGLSPEQSPATTNGSSVTQFTEALEAAQGQFAAPPAQPGSIDDAASFRVAQVGEVPLPPSVPAQAPTAVQLEGQTDLSRQRALDGLALDGEAAPAPTGRAILSGLEQLRTVFDAQIDSVASRSEGAQMDVSDMMALQAEVVKYTVLVDVSSKLAGKTTQAMDSLMKGQ